MAEHPSWVVTDDEAGLTLAAFLRLRLPGQPWRRVKGWVETGKVSVGGRRELEAGFRVKAGERIALDMDAPRPLPGGPQPRVVYQDPELLVIDKPAGVTSVPFEEDDRDTALDLVRVSLRRQGARGTEDRLHVVHLLDRETSGLMLLARTKLAEKGLAAQLRAHTVERVYLCVAHGTVRAGRIASRLVDDRGDGLRGSAKRGAAGKLAVTHVRPLAALDGATACAVRLETGRTHQIRIHLAEQGHPLVGERVYVRDFVRGGGRLIESPRVLLHAATLGFLHPTREVAQRFTLPLPEDFVAVLERLGGRAPELERALHGG
jgi:23S rRNA pseudouridine1911/1915/1917 synthase